MPFSERKIGIKNSSTGHTVEEVIVRRHADLSRSMTRSRIRIDSRNQFSSTDRSGLLVHHDGYFPPTGYTVLGNDCSDGYNNQQYDHHSRDSDDSSLRSLTNYCQSLRFRVAELESLLEIEHGKALAISSKEIFMSGSNPHMRSASRAPTLTPIAGPYSGSYHSKGDEIVRKIKFSTTAGNYFGSKKETIAGSSTSVVQEQSFKNFSDDVSSLDLAETMHIKGAIEVKYSAASSSRDVVLLVEEEKTKRICLKEEVLTKCSIGASAAVTRIAGCVRKFLHRKHSKERENEEGPKELRSFQCGHVMILGDRTVDPRVEQQQRIIQTRHMKSILRAWKDVTKRRLPHRNKIDSLCRAGAIKRREKALRKCFRALFEGTLGSHSSKVTRAARKELTSRIRQDLSDQVKMRSQGESGVVLAEEVQQALHRHLIFNQTERHKNVLLKSAFSTLTDILRKARDGQETASQHWFHTRVGACFSAWSQWIFLISLGLDRKRWKGGGRFVTRYNQRRLDNFSRVRVLRSIFFPWKACHVISMRIRGALRRKAEQIIRKHFKALLDVTRAQRRIRRDVVERWKGYTASILTGPFKAWSGLAAAARAAVSDGARLAAAYRKWKVRQFHKIILRTWRHQALYGRTDGLYSRAMLSKGLKDQRVLTERLEKMLIAQTAEMEECREFMDSEVAKRHGLEWQLQAAAEDSQRQEMFCHHAEQEVKRVSALVEAMAAINPRQAEHLIKLQRQFRFKDRRIGSALSAIPPTCGRDVVSLSTELLLDSESPLRPRYPAHDLLKEEEGEGVETGRGGEDQREEDAIVGTALVANPNISLKPQEASHSPSPMLEKDRLLLARAKWLVSSFTDDVDTEGPKTANKVPSDHQQIVRNHTRHTNESSRSSYVISSSLAVTAGVGTGTISCSQVSSVELEVDKVAAVAVAEHQGQGQKQDKSVESPGWLSSDGRMLLSIVDFLVEGNLNLFSAEDKRRWTKDVLKNLISETSESNGMPRTAREVEANEGNRGNGRYRRCQKDGGRITTDSPGYVSAGSSGSVSDLEAEGGIDVDRGGPQAEDEDEDSIRGFHTWRQTLVQMRTLYPGLGKHSGMGVSLDPTEGDGGQGMCARLCEMRDTQQEVLSAKRMIGRGKVSERIKGHPTIDLAAVVGEGVGAKAKERGREARQITSFYKGHLDGQTTM